MKKMNSKKAMSQLWWIISTAVIALVVVILLLVWFKGSGTKLFDNLDDTIGGLDDVDNDGVTDVFDKCPCDPAIGKDLLQGQTCGVVPDKVTKKCPGQQ
jgi:hypothetical protein